MLDTKQLREKVEELHGLIASTGPVSNSSIPFKKNQNPAGQTQIVNKIAELFSKLSNEDKKLVVNEKRYFGTTALMAAARHGHSDVVKVLLDNGANVHTGDLRPETALYIAIEAGHGEVAKLILENKNFNVQNERAMIIMGLAIRKDLPEIAKLLIEKGVGINDKTDLGLTPLHIAVSHGNFDLAEFFIKEKSADIHAKDDDGDTPLHMAAFHGNSGIEKLLLENGADGNAKNRDDKIPTHRARTAKSPSHVAMVQEQRRDESASRLQRRGSIPDIVQNENPEQPKQPISRFNK